MPYLALPRDAEGPEHKAPDNISKTEWLAQNSTRLPRITLCSEHLQTQMTPLFFLLYRSSITVFISGSVTRFMCLSTFHKVKRYMIKKSKNSTINHPCL